MTVVLVALGFADDTPCPHAGQYVQSFDFDAHDGQGFGRFTTDIEKAHHFKDAAEALTFWRTVSTVRPRRPDGRPNRPLTALSVELKTVPPRPNRAPSPTSEPRHPSDPKR